MQDILSGLFRKIEADLGTHEFCILVLRSLKNALRQYRVKDKEELLEQLKNVFLMIKDTKPRYAILMTSFYRFLEFYENQKDSRSLDELIDEIERISISYQLETKQIVKAAQEIDVEGKTILIHDHSHSVQRVLQSFINQHKHFKVVIAEQDLEKTEDNIEFCHRAGIPYKVVPAYMLSHVDKSIDMLFAGAVTFQENDQFVMDPGSKSVISQFYLEKKPVYIFTATSKFSLWSIAGQSPTIYSLPHKRSHHTLKEIEFERLKFSHDRVPLELISHVITEKGIHNPTEIKKLFADMFKKRTEERKKFGMK